MQRFRIKVRLAELGIKSVDVITALRKRGYRVDPSEFSCFVGGRRTGPKADMVLEAADRYLSELEEAQYAKGSEPYGARTRNIP